jgi:hypothetical protein
VDSIVENKIKENKLANLSHEVVEKKVISAPKISEKSTLVENLEKNPTNIVKDKPSETLIKPATPKIDTKIIKEKPKSKTPKIVKNNPSETLPKPVTLKIDTKIIKEKPKIAEIVPKSEIPKIVNDKPTL